MSMHDMTQYILEHMMLANITCENRMQLYISASHINIYLAYIHRRIYTYIICMYHQDLHGQDKDVMYISLCVSCITIFIYIISQYV